LALDVVIKFGGGLLRAVDDLDTVLGMVAEFSRSRRVLIVPGGGPFADAVREVDGRIGVADDAAHWMAVLAMDQYAHLLASRLSSGVVVTDSSEAVCALRNGALPVLAPSRWLMRADPLPHSWDVTSDSIAAWVAGELDARYLVLIKPAGASGELVDPYFSRALAADVTSLVVPADRVSTAFAQITGGRP
jgi:aspartokinase-like uncharacterized kinase